MPKRCVFNSLLKQIKGVAIFSSRGRALHKRGAEAAMRSVSGFTKVCSGEIKCDSER